MLGKSNQQLVLRYMYYLTGYSEIFFYTFMNFLCMNTLRSTLGLHAKTLIKNPKVFLMNYIIYYEISILLTPMGFLPTSIHEMGSESIEKLYMQLY